MVTFTATPQPRPRGGIRIALPFDPAQEWGERETYHLTGTVAGCTIRGAVSPGRGEEHLDLGPTWVRDARADTTREVRVVLELEGPQFAGLDEDLRTAIGPDSAAGRFFDELPTTYREKFVDWVTGAKRPETRSRRIAATAEALRAGRREA